MTTTWLRQPIEKGERLPLTLLSVWALSMISLPIARWTFGEVVIPWDITVSTLLQAAAAIAVLLGSAWTMPKIVRTVGTILLIAFLVEFVGSQTGFPFGAYHYTDQLQPQLGNVPLILPLAWLMMLPAAWAVAACITDAWRGWRFILVSVLAFTAWDLFLDPQMVGWNLWEWAQPGGYFGIPWVNYAGWLLASALITLLARPQPLPLRPLLIMYATVWALQAIGQLFFWNLPGPALVGFVGMGVPLAAALWLQRERTS
jgi:putative membrane protein